MLEIVDNCKCYMYIAKGETQETVFSPCKTARINSMVSGSLVASSGKYIVELLFSLKKNTFRLQLSETADTDPVDTGVLLYFCVAAISYTKCLCQTILLTGNVKVFAH